ncbi:MAG TPA: hypothetical protein VNN79_13475, partial [Actinomycetota bacterium]|nr:hypothetical protein [Actinomycetota bacterium]
MTFRARLTLFFVGIVAAPLIVGAVVAANASHTQAVRDADARLQVAAVTASGALQLERVRVSRIVSPEFALRAYRTADQATLDQMRAGERLDYLVVTGPDGATRASLALPEGIEGTADGIAEGSLAPVAAQHTVVLHGAPGARVIGGRLWRSNVPSTLGVTDGFVVNGRTAGPSTASLRPVTLDGHRAVCVCVGGATPSGLVLSTPVHSAGLSRWFRWPAIGLVLIGLAVLVGLAYLLARILTRPLARLAEEVAAVARGEPDVQPAV